MSRLLELLLLGSSCLVLASSLALPQPFQKANFINYGREVDDLLGDGGVGLEGGGLGEVSAEDGGDPEDESPRGGGTGRTGGLAEDADLAGGVGGGAAGPLEDPDSLAVYLTSLLAQPDSAQLPLVYLPMEKRSRYYRRYPWKRQNGRNYDPDAYLCTPTKQDVFHLLLALHDARSGNLDRQVHFCNRRRPARAIFTNIRFLGRR